jgi:hypothetical protein
MQLLFEERIALADAAVAKQDFDAFNLAIDLIGQDLAALPEKSLAVREKWRDKRGVERPEVLKTFTATTRALLRNEMAPLMQWRNLEGCEPAYRFDKLVAQLQTALVLHTSQVEDRKAALLEQVAQLPLTLIQVQEKRVVIEEVKSPAFWKAASVPALERIRTELRSLMQHRQRQYTPPPASLVLDVHDSGVEYTAHTPKLEGLDLVAYRFRVENVLRGLIETSPVLRKIKAPALSQIELDALARHPASRSRRISITALLTASRPAADDSTSQPPPFGLEPPRSMPISRTSSSRPRRCRATSFAFRHVKNTRTYGVIEVEQLFGTPPSRHDRRHRCHFRRRQSSRRIDRDRRPYHDGVFAHRTIPLLNKRKIPMITGPLRSQIDQIGSASIPPITNPYRVDRSPS